MATEGEQALPALPWYSKFFEYWRNRNRVGPGKVELPDCDFFIVGPRRTLRVLKPSLKSGWYYENTNDRPESIHDNFFTRWSRRPHSSGNCRCSFRHSNRVSTTEEQIISAELNRIRTSLCEAEKTEQGIEELEQRVSVNLQKLQASVPEKEQSATEEKASKTELDEPHIDEQGIKNKIVKDLERYINVLLEEILDDTVKYVAGAEDTLIKDVKTKNDASHSSLDTDKPTSKSNPQKEASNDGNPDTEPSSGNEISFNDISFSFHAGRIAKESANENGAIVDQGYVNRAFIGSTNDPDSLDFYLRRTVGTEVTLEQLDCIDSGINSVETIEFQPDQEPSLEQSLLQIIDEKLGRTPLRSSWEDLRAGAREKPSEESPSADQERRQPVEEAIPRSGEHLSIDGTSERSEVRPRNDAERSRREDSGIEAAEGIDISPDNLGGAESVDLKKLEETANEASFEKLRLEFKDEGSALRTKKGKTMSKLKERFCGNLEESGKAPGKNWKNRKGASEPKKEPKAIEMEDYRRKWPDLEESVSSPEQSPRDFVIFRKNRKPAIVFLHGFGSSAEIFEHQLEYFSALGYPCIAPDMLGHGMSSAPDRSRDYHFGKLLKDLDAVLHHYAFNPGQKCVLVAHNYGCSFATALACKYDSNIHQLVLISGGGPTPLAPPTTETAGHCFLRAILAPFLMCGLHRDILYSARGRQHPYCGPEPLEQWPSHMKYVLDGMVWPEGDYVFHRRICTPTLLIHGLRDNKVSLVQECQMERTMMKAFLEAIPAAGHTPMTECPTQLNHMIHCFIDLWKNKKW
ncbi:hypothetical protein KM043_006027 [Ampulex compressa]|nr:hypothetical protein KM043_006027 [Ampulex compressa]